MYIIRDKNLLVSRSGELASQVEPPRLWRSRQRVTPWLRDLLAARMESRVDQAADCAVADTGHPGVIADFLRAGGENPATVGRPTQSRANGQR